MVYISAAKKLGLKPLVDKIASMLRELLRFRNVPAYLSATTKAITAEGVVIDGPQGQQTVPADSVILSVGYTPDTRFAAQKGQPNVYFIGDCDKVGSLKTVVKQAYELVQQISYR